MAGTDENEDSIVSPFYRTGKNKLAIAHKHYLKKEREEDTQAAIEEMEKTASEYHIAYRERRRNWKSIPAKELAKNIFIKQIADPSAVATTDAPFTFQLIDFGCGEDLLFEKKLCELVSDHDGTGHVKVLGVDVKEYFDQCLHSGEGIGTHGQLTFSHKGLACNYYDLEKQEEFSKWCGKQRADAAVFCLSLMLMEAVPEGLIAAVNVVKFGGPIYIVLDITKFGLHVALNRQVKENALASWKSKFATEFRGLLEVVNLKEKSDGMVYIELKNVSSEEDRRERVEKLRKPTPTTIDSFRINEDIINDITEGVSRKRRSSDLG